MVHVLRPGRERRGLIAFVAIAVLTLAVAILSAPAGARADEITAALPGFDDSNVQAFDLCGSATLESPWLQLTPSVNDVSGAAWWLHKVYLGDDRSFRQGRGGHRRAQVTRSGSIGGHAA